MLTGDKVETAKCIAITTGLKKKESQIFEIVENKKENLNLESEIERIREKITTYEKRNRDDLLIVDGKILSVILEE